LGWLNNENDDDDDDDHESESIVSLFYWDSSQQYSVYKIRRARITEVHFS